MYSLYTFTMGAIDLARRCPRGRFAELAGIHAQGFPVRCSAAASEGRAKVPCVCHFTTSASSSIIASFLRKVNALRHKKAHAKKRLATSQANCAG